MHNIQHRKMEEERKKEQEKNKPRSHSPLNGQDMQDM